MRHNLINYVNNINCKKKTDIYIMNNICHIFFEYILYRKIVKQIYYDSIRYIFVTTTLSICVCFL